jgi:lipoprotein-anchoring transpeptidase ErfK/SrfK
MQRLALALATALLLCSALAAPAARADDFQPFWVMTQAVAPLWSAADATGVAFGVVPPWRYLAVVSPPGGPRVQVWDPRNELVAYVDAPTPAGVQPPNEDQLARNVGPPLLARPNLPARAVGDVQVRSWPRTDEATLIRHLANNDPVWVYESVLGDDGAAWYRLSGQEYVAQAALRLPRPPAGTQAGRWIDADLESPTLVTAYEGDRAVYAALAIPGVRAFQTPTGTFQIERRVENETMDSATVGIPRNGPGGYYLENVLFTQYFTNDGASLHYNWWRGTFGQPGSHGCLGLNYADAKWFWEWTSLGTPVIIRH